MAKLMCYGYIRFGLELSRNNWNDDNLPEDWIFIEIGEYTPSLSEVPWLKESSQVIHLNFDDIGEYRVWEAIPDFPWTEEYKKRYENNYGMSKDDAKVLFGFLESNLGKNIMIHCSAGVSRSQGVVKFLLDCYPEFYSEEETNKYNPCRTPNTYVVRLLKEEYYDKYGKPFEN